MAAMAEAERTAEVTRRTKETGVELTLRLDGTGEGARNTAGIEDASTTEFGETSEPVVGLISEWMSEEGLQKRSASSDMGGTMRLGAYKASLKGNSHVASIYGSTEISERHRHRYEVNVHYRDEL